MSLLSTGFLQGQGSAAVQLVPPLPWWAVLAFYLSCSWLVGFFLAMTFQLAHCVDTVEFPPASVSRRGESFYVHQLRTTSNIASRAIPPVILDAPRVRSRKTIGTWTIRAPRRCAHQVVSIWKP